jgi:phosphopantothenoylcysteine decarboxylase/phosphopantothenate--cysteine ligase
MARSKKKELFIIGFSLETDNHIENAKLKLKEKKLDLIVLNDVVAMGSMEAKVTLIDKELKVKTFGMLPKSEIAKELISYIATQI